MKKFLLSLLLVAAWHLCTWRVAAQTTIGANQAPDSSAILDLRSSNRGLLLPQVSLDNTGNWGLAGATPREGMVIYNTNASITGSNAQGAGMYVWSGSSWKKAVTDVAVNGDNLGNHTATQRLDMNNFSVYGADSLIAGNARLSSVTSGAATDSLLTISATGDVNKRTVASLANDNSFVTNLISNSQFKDSVSNIVQANGDNLGNHTATQRLNMNNFSVYGADSLIAGNARLSSVTSGAATDSLLTISATGDVNKRTVASLANDNSFVTNLISNTQFKDSVSNIVQANGDNLGNHTAAQDLNMNSFNVYGADAIIANKAQLTAVPSAATTDSILTIDASGNVRKRTATSLGDNLGNHTATQDMNMNSFNVYGAETLIANKAQLTAVPSAATTDSILTIDASGNVRKRTGASLGDNLGNHTATQHLNMNSYSIYGADTLIANNAQLAAVPSASITDSILTIDATGNVRKRTATSLNDNLGNHTAAQDLNMNSFNVYGAETLIANKAQLKAVPSASTTDSILTIDASGNVRKRTATSLGDNLGNHTATQHLNMNNFSVYGADTLIANSAQLAAVPSAATTDSILTIDASGNVRKRTATSLNDNLGNHTAAQDLNMNSFNVYGADAIIANKAQLTAVPSASITDSILTIDAIGNVRKRTANSLGDNLGNHTATQHLNMNNFSVYGADTLIANNAQLAAVPSAAATDSILTIDATGNVRKRTAASLGDNLGNHIATQRLNMNNFNVYGADTLIAHKAQLTAIPSAAATDSILTIDASGNVRKRTAASLGDNLGNHTATTTLNMANNVIDNANNIKILYQATIYERALADKAGNYALYTSNGTFRVWSSKYASDRFAIDSTGRVGVGTSTPKNKFSVSGGAISMDDWIDGDKYLLFGVTGSSKIATTSGWNVANYAGQITDQNGTAVSNQTGSFSWNTANNGAWAERMRLANDGSLTVGGSLKLGAVAPAAATDSVLTADANGNVHKMAQGNIGSNTMNIVSTTSGTYTPTATDNVIIVDAASNNVTVAVPAATAATKGRVYTIKRIDNTANDVFIDFGTAHIDNTTDTKLSVGNGVTIQFIDLNTTQWYTISKF